MIWAFVSSVPALDQSRFPTGCGASGWAASAPVVQPRARAPPPQVSDLDGTMVGEGALADGMTREFCEYWEGTAALVGSVLVYNTGRSLGQFVALMAEKQGALALPDVLITAVGTKVRVCLSACLPACLLP
jgi:Sucrose-6F-phosphate phosphohydrolase